jgi:hypothetical protein
MGNSHGNNGSNKNENSATTDVDNKRSITTGMRTNGISTSFYYIKKDDTAVKKKKRKYRDKSGNKISSAEYFSSCGERLIEFCCNNNLTEVRILLEDPEVECFIHRKNKAYDKHT